jgi:hypothetical protein
MKRQGACVDDQIWQVQKIWSIWFSIPDCPVSAVSEQSQEGAKFEDLDIQRVLKQEKGIKGIK